MDSMIFDDIFNKAWPSKDSQKSITNKTIQQTSESNVQIVQQKNNEIEIKESNQQPNKLEPISDLEETKKLETAKKKKEILKEESLEIVISNKSKDPIKQSKLDELKSEIGKFDKFSYIDMVNNLVFCDGNPDSKIMFVGEAPGEEEDIQGKPFVGRSGQLISKFLEELGYDRTKYYITNVVYWRPPGNRTPFDEEITAMVPFLLKHIEIIEPDYIVTIGAVASRALGITMGITKAQGNFYEMNLDTIIKKDSTNIDSNIFNQTTQENSDQNQRSKRLIFPVYHPSYALRLPAKKKDLWLSLLKLDDAVNKN